MRTVNHTVLYFEIQVLKVTTSLENIGHAMDEANAIQSQYKKLSLIYHPDKPTGNEKLFMKLRKAYDALTDETARYNWEHYGNPDGPQAMQFGIGLPAWIVEEKNSVWVLGVYALIFMIGKYQLHQN